MPRMTKKKILAGVDNVFQAASERPKRFKQGRRGVDALRDIILAHLKRTPLDVISGRSGRFTPAERLRWKVLEDAANGRND